MKNEKDFRLSKFEPLLTCIKPFKKHISVLIISGAGWSIFTVLRAYSIKMIIDSLSTSGVANIHWPVALYFISWFGTDGFMRLRDFVVMYLKPYLKKHIVVYITNRMHQYSAHFFHQNLPGGLVNSVRNLYDGIDDGIYIVEELFTHVILILSAFISLFILNKYLGSVILIWCTVWAIFAYFWARKGHLLAMLAHRVRMRMTSYLSDMFSNIVMIKTFNAVKHEIALTEKLTNDVAKIEFRREKMFLFVWITQGLLFFFVLFLVFKLLIWQYSLGKVTIGDFGMLMELLICIYLYLFDLAKDLSEFSETTGKITQGLNALYREIDDSLDKIKNKFVPGKGSIVLDKVQYVYPEGQYGLFLKQKIEIAGGSTVALVGPSGSGKSTMIKLLLKLVQPISGKILIDGQDIGECDPDSVRKMIAYVPQETGLFYRSIRDNIKYGSFDKSDKEMITCAKKAQIHDFIMSLPHGYNTIYGEQMNFSGGQKQRLMIARGLLRRSKIFIFDESTSALDLKTENEVMRSITECTHGCTKIVIAHRLQTIKDIDLILVCYNGEVVEHGNHAALMKKKGLYYSLYKLI